VDPYHPLAKAAQQDKRRQYRGATTWTDFNVGRLLQALDANGFANDTLVIFHGDHGWLLGEHGGYCKQSNWELVARVPLIVRVPWLPATRGVRSKALVEIVDLYPTALELMGIGSAQRVPDLAQLEGTSFAPLLNAGASLLQSGTMWKNATFTQYPRCKSTKEGTPPNDAPWKSPTNNPCTHVKDHAFDAMGYSIRSDRWRYTLWVRWDGASKAPIWSQVVGEELYDHQGDDGRDTDAFENVNLVDEEHAGVRAQMKVALMAGWRASKPVIPTPAR
jgi:iduronate 2-sulfatase